MNNHAIRFLAAPAPADAPADALQAEAAYLGVKNYGAEDVNADAKDSFEYRFLVDRQEATFAIDPGEPDGDGGFAYPIQNTLKEGYRFAITVEDGTSATRVQ